jgi:tetratricopeptide (TPR) repeat protein
MQWRIVLVLVFLLIYFPASTQEKKTDNQSSYRDEAYVVEQQIDHWIFENDGTATRDTTTRVRIQSDAGVQRFGILTSPYENATESLDISYVRVRKPDGTTINTPADDIQDIPMKVTREAPMYSDFREKQLAVKGLSSGDLLEYQCRWKRTKPLVSGQFWMNYRFVRDEIVLEEKLQVSVPRARAVKVRSPSLAPTVTDEGDHRVYSWSRSNLEHTKPIRLDLVYLISKGQLPAADVQVSSFQSWDELGRWYDGLQRERIQPSPEIQAKAAELTRNAADDSAKIHAIYKYVSTEFRYIAVEFGIGRYQPHAAAEVFSNHYGDCKDKHTLLASLLNAAGIPAYAALINSSHTIESELPSPSQFNHVITAIPQGKNWIWLDTTTEVGPFGYLSPPLRGKPALVILPDKPASFQTTPASFPYPHQWTFKIEAKLDDTGTLEGKVEESIRSDLEVILRAALRRLSRVEWKDLVQRMSYATGFGGEVSDVTVSTPEATGSPLHFTYTYKRKKYPDWENHRIAIPAPDIFLVPSEENGKLPQRFWLGEPGAFQFDVQVELPAGYEPLLPPKKDMQGDFAEYHAIYQLEDNTLVAQFRIVVKVAEVAGDKVREYKEFAEEVHKDRERLIPIVQSRTASAPTPISQQMLPVLEAGLRTLPDTTDSKARDMLEKAKQAVLDGTPVLAQVYLEQAVEQDRKFTRGWVMLGRLHMLRKDQDVGIAAFRKAVESDPKQPLSYKMLAWALETADRRSDAIRAWQDLAEVAPEDTDIPANVSSLLIAEKRFQDAVPYLETVVKLHPDRPGPLVQLGSAYLRSDQDEKAAQAFDKAIHLDSGAGTRNDISYSMAVANKRLGDALKYAEGAVNDEEAASQKIKLAGLNLQDLQITRRLGLYWDTLGWVQYRRGDLKKAEDYLYVAWMLLQDPVNGYHLAQVYEKLERSEEAERLYLVVAALTSRSFEGRDAIAEAKSRIQSASSQPGARRPVLLLATDARRALSQDRTAMLPSLTGKEPATAEFFVVFARRAKGDSGALAAAASPDRSGMVEDAKFIKGSELLRSAADALRQAHFKVPFPENSPAKLVRRGLLTCHSTSGCSFVLVPVESVTSVD